MGSLSEIDRFERLKKLLNQQEELIKINYENIKYVFKKDRDSSEYYYEKYDIRIYIIDGTILYSISGKEIDRVSSRQLIYQLYNPHSNKYFTIIVKILTVLKEINDKIIERRRKLEEDKERRRKLEEDKERRRKLEERSRELAFSYARELEEQHNHFVKNITRDKLTDLINKRVFKEKTINGGSLILSRERS
jgi:hypothetical protein